MQIENLLVKEVMLSCNFFPIVSEKELLKETIIEMCNYKLGISCIVDSQNQLKGVFTDGDIRRLILKVQKPIAALFVDDVIDYATKEYTSVNPETSLKKAVLVMEKFNIWDLPVTDEKKVLKGLLHLHPALKKLLGI
tara:strand:+ start:632 stop:1042 length:411 start_codon:yes stop_codon:yes gene_type:complete